MDYKACFLGIPITWTQMIKILFEHGRETNFHTGTGKPIDFLDIESRIFRDGTILTLCLNDAVNVENEIYVLETDEFKSVGVGGSGVIEITFIQGGSLISCLREILQYATFMYEEDLRLSYCGSIFSFDAAIEIACIQDKSYQNISVLVMNHITEMRSLLINQGILTKKDEIVLCRNEFPQDTENDSETDKEIEYDSC